MCLLLFAFHVREEFPLIVAANRDEFYDRPSAPADFWVDAPHILAGRDLNAGGTWLGITRSGGIAALTNYRDPASFRADAPSRGALVSGFLRENRSAERYLAGLAPDAGRYNGFNLLTGDSSGLFYFSNRAFSDRHLLADRPPEMAPLEKISPGIHGLSNSLLDVPWPKVLLGKRKMGALLAARKKPTLERLFALLSDRTPAPDDRLPSTGVGREGERMLSPLFIHSAAPAYGTRSSTVILVDREGRVEFAERVFDERGNPWMTSRFVIPRESTASME